MSVPDLPRNVNYDVWARGYGLWIRPKCAPPGQHLNLIAVTARDEKCAAHTTLRLVSRRTSLRTLQRMSQ